jgi:hypothetical protein
VTADVTGLQEIWSAAALRPAVARFRSAECGVDTPNGPILAAVEDTGRRHLLVPIASQHTLREEPDGQAVTLRRRVLEDPSSYRTYAALALVDDRLSDLFTALCAEIVERIAEKPDKAVAALRRTLADWRSLLAGSPQRLGPAQLAGLFGELHVLRAMVALDPGAVAFWTGHSGTAQDFHRGTTALEIKSTTVPEGRTVRIHGLGQLDSGDGERLLLVWIRLRTDRGRSVPELVDEILAATDDESTFLMALHSAGYNMPDRQYYENRLFEVVEQQTFEVGPGFPRITAAGLTVDAALAGLDGVHYDLDLHAAPAVQALVDLDPATAFLEPA